MENAKMKYFDVGQSMNANALKKHMKNNRYFSGGHIDRKIYSSTKYCLNSAVARMSACIVDIDCIAARSNGKIKSWWFNPLQAYKIALEFDDYLNKRNEVKWNNFFSIKQSTYKKYIKEFWQENTLEDITAKDDMHFFNKAYFFMQADKYYWRSENWHKAVADKNIDKSFKERNYKKIEGYWIEKEIMEALLKDIYDKKEISSMYDKRVKIVGGIFY